MGEGGAVLVQQLEEADAHEVKRQKSQEESEEEAKGRKHGGECLVLSYFELRESVRSTNSFSGSTLQKAHFKCVRITPINDHNFLKYSLTFHSSYTRMHDSHHTIV